MENTNIIYGVSSKNINCGWEHVVYAFSSEENAQKWLHTEEYDFRERELCSKSKATRLAGVKAVRMAAEQLDINVWGM